MPRISTPQTSQPSEAHDRSFVPTTPDDWADPDPQTIGEALDALASVAANHVVAAAVIADNVVVRGDGGARGLQGSFWAILDAGDLVARTGGNGKIVTEGGVGSISILPDQALALGTSRSDSVTIGRAAITVTIDAAQTWGGDVDLNAASFDFTRGAEIVLRLLDVASAADFLTISNQPLPNGTSGPLITVDGTSVNTDLRLAGKGTGYVRAGGLVVAPQTTKGDLVVYSTDNIRLAVGTNDQVLTADSAQASGVKWAAAAGGATPPRIWTLHILYPQDGEEFVFAFTDAAITIVDVTTILKAGTVDINIEHRAKTTPDVASATKVWATDEGVTTTSESHTGSFTDATVAADKYLAITLANPSSATDLYISIEATID